MPQGGLLIEAGRRPGDETVDLNPSRQESYYPGGPGSVRGEIL